MNAILGWLGGRAIAIAGIVLAVGLALLKVRKAGRDSAIAEAQAKTIEGVEKANEARRDAAADPAPAGRLLRDWNRDRR